jgi:hypothetical protein
MPSGHPYEVLPKPRGARDVNRRDGTTYHIPGITAQAFRDIVAAERLLLPATWDQDGMLRRRWAMLGTINQVNAANAALVPPGHIHAAFKICPIAKSGRVFVSYDNKG